MRSLTTYLACAIVLAGAAAATQQTPIPVRSLTPAVGTDSGVLGALDDVRPLANGKVIVNDVARGRLIMFEQTLQRFTTIMDTAAGAPTMYPLHSGAVIMRYPGDSTAFLDVASKAFVIISPAGRIVRTMAMPNARDALSLTVSFRGAQGFDDKGRLVFNYPTSDATEIPPPADGTGYVVYWSHNFGIIIRRDPASGRTDTLGTVGGGLFKHWKTFPADRGFTRGARIPIPTVDDWTLLPDGTVAIVRGHDYHIDWIHPDGTMTSSPKMPFDWLRITPEQKKHMADSINAGIAARAASATPPPPAPPGFPARPDMSSLPPVSFEADSFPDYYPPVRDYTVKSDPNGNVWVLPTTSVLADGGLIYDVINRKGEIVERVKLPPNRRLLAVGYRGVVYMAYTPKGLVRLERATIIR